MRLHGTLSLPSGHRPLMAAVALCALMLLPLSANATPLAQSLKQHGLQPIDPPSAAADFDLPTLAGSQIKLSDTQGRWVLLTFFATWCGPCMAEMPSLIRFQELHHKRGVDVLAISGDTTVAPVHQLAREKNINFPILLDPQGRVAGQYRASSIPVSYLINPEGLLIAVARGARDWSSMGRLVDTLLSTEPAMDSPSGSYQAGNAPIELPEVLNPPTATVLEPTTPPQPGVPFDMDVKVIWAGNFEEYLLQPPRITLPDGAEQLGMKALSSSVDGNRAITYRFTFKVDEPGNYAFDPVELRYTPRFDPQEVTERLDGPTVSIAAPKLPTKVLVGLALAAAGFMVWLLSRRHERAPKHTRLVNEGPEALRESLGAARRKRIDGDIAGFLEAIRSIHERFEIEDLTGQRQALDQWIEESRYGGQHQGAPALDQLERAVEIHLASLAPAESDAERDAIKYADQPR